MRNRRAFFQVPFVNCEMYNYVANLPICIWTTFSDVATLLSST